MMSRMGAMRQVFAVIVVAFAGVFVAGTVLAQLNPDTAIRYRKQIFSAISAHFAAVNIIAKNPGVYDKDLAFHADALVQLSTMPWQAFAAGTDEGTERTTASKKIWQDPTGFTAAQDKFKSEVAKLKELSTGADAKALAQQVGMVGMACKSCHEDYRD